MVIDSDEYKYDSCTITNDECTGESCRDCEVAEENERLIKQQLEEKEREGYTKFERNSKISGITITVDFGGVIAKTDMDTLKRLQESTPFFKTTVISYHPDNLKQYSENLRKLRRYNGLGIPDMIWGAKDYPAAFLFGDVVYLIAPRIESES